MIGPLSLRASETAPYASHVSRIRRGIIIMIIASITALFVRGCRALEHRRSLATSLTLLGCDHRSTTENRRISIGAISLPMINESGTKCRWCLGKYIVRKLLLRRLLHLGDLNLLVVLNLNFRFQHDG